MIINVNCKDDTLTNCKELLEYSKNKKSKNLRTQSLCYGKFIGIGKHLSDILKHNIDASHEEIIHLSIDLEAIEDPEGDGLTKREVRELIEEVGTVEEIRELIDDLQTEICEYQEDIREINDIVYDERSQLIILSTQRLSRLK